MNPDIQIILINIALAITTVLVIAIGIQLILLLRDIRKTLKKIFSIIEAFENTGINAKEGMEEIIGFITGIKSVIKIVSKIKK